MFHAPYHTSCNNPPRRPHGGAGAPLPHPNRPRYQKLGMPIDSHEDQCHPSSPFLYCHRLETSIFDIWDDRARWYMGHRPHLDRVLLGKCREEKSVPTGEPNKSFYYTDLENSMVETTNSMGEGRKGKSWLYSIPRTRPVFWITVAVL